MFLVRRSKVGDLMVTQRESEANVVDAANRVTGRSVLPNLIHQALRSLPPEPRLPLK